MSAGFSGFRIDLFSKNNGKLDFLLRLTQVKIAAVGDGHAQLIEHAVRQFCHSLTRFVRDFSHRRSELLKLAVRAIGIEHQIRGTAGQIIHTEGYRSVGMHVANGCGIAPAGNRTFTAALLKLLLGKNVSCRLIQIHITIRHLRQIHKAILQAQQLQIARRAVERIAAVAGIHTEFHSRYRSSRCPRALRPEQS